MKTNRAIKIIQITALLLLACVVVYIAYSMIKRPELATAEGIAQLVSDNMIIAVLEFWLLYLLKGISFIFPSATINVAAGAVFGFPMSIFVSSGGILIEFLIMYFIGRLFGDDVVEWITNKYPKTEVIRKINSNNGIGISFVIRITGLISYDVGSLYLGATGVRIDRFIIGSMLGALFNIVLANLFGQYMFNPLCWQLWAIVVIRIVAIVTWKLAAGRGLGQNVDGEEQKDNQ